MDDEPTTYWTSRPNIIISKKNTYNIAHPIFGKNFKSIPEWIEGKLYTKTVSLEGETMVSQRLSLQSTAGILRYP